jgi:cysteine desulfurase
MVVKGVCRHVWAFLVCKYQEKITMANQPIYLDYMATTPVDPRVCDDMVAVLRDMPGNAGSTSHVYGWEAEQAVAKARAQVAALIHADAREVIWTSGATEANNMAIKGAALQYARKGRHLITSCIEHAAVLQCFRHLETQGFEVTYLSPDAKGLISPDQLQQALREDTILVSIMHANNEVGTIQPIAAMGQLLKGRGIVFHVDAAQSLGKIDIDVEAMGVDMLCASAHKCYGPKGVGMLYLRQNPRVRLLPLMHGGGQEHGLRSGTVATHQVVGFGSACALAKAKMHEESARLLSYRESLWDALVSLSQVQINGDRQQRLPGQLHFSVLGQQAEVMMKAMPGLALSSTSACQQEAAEPSHVLLAMGLTPVQAQGSLRLAFGRFSTEDDVATVKKTLVDFLDRITA